MAKFSFYPLEVEYKVFGDRTVVQLYGKTTNGKQICVQDSTFKPYFYVLAEKTSPEEIVAKLNNLNLEKSGRKILIIGTEIVQKKYKGRNVQCVKAYTALPKDIPFICNHIKSQLMPFESDILFTRRYLIDNNLTPMVLTDVEGEFINQKSKVSVVNAESITQTSTEIIKDIKIMAVDIETYNPLGKHMIPEENPIVMIGLYGDNFKKVIVSRQFKTNLDYVEPVDNEAQLIIKFKEAIETYKPDIITGYYSDAFDLPYIATRAEKNNITLPLGLDYSEMQIDKRGDVNTKITGIVHLDIFQFISRIFATTLETPTYDLDSVSKELLDQTKEHIDIETLHEVFDSHPEKLDQFCEYNLKDSQLTHELAVSILPNIIEIVKAVGLPLYDISRMSFSQLVEWYLIQRTKDFNELIPNKPEHEELRARRASTFKGAFVIKPQPGLYENLVVLDFRSLYPSIIVTHNISPETLNCSCCEGKDVAPGEKDWFCKKKKGFISTVIEGLITRRMRIKEITKTKDSKILFARQYALKTIANAMYGYLGFFMARWYCLECAQSITAYGRHYIQELIEKAKEENFKILYGDTDSVFLALDSKTREETNKFVDEFNLKLPEFMELELEGYYPKGIFVSAKMGAFGAKKKYALLSENGSIKITGFGTVRRNISKIAKDTQEEVLRIILKEDNTEKAFNLVRLTIDKVKQKKIAMQDMVIYTRLQKNIAEYESIGPHVAVAKRLQQKGYDVGPGTMIRYIVSSTGEKIRDKARLPEEIEKGDYDTEYYINNQIIPVVEKIFEVLGYSKEDLMATPDQKKLDKFFG